MQKKLEIETTRAWEEDTIPRVLNLVFTVAVAVAYTTAILQVVPEDNYSSEFDSRFGMWTCPYSAW